MTALVSRPISQRQCPHLASIKQRRITSTADWATELVSRAEILRLIYQGRFLHSSVTLGALGLPSGRTTVMHLVPREHLPEPNSHGQ